jgi:cell division protein FtsI/penicillin-binding protein 2
MVNWPTFDPETGQGPDGKYAGFNPNIMEYLEPGSTMKILTLAKAIEDQHVSSGWTLNCNGTLRKGPYQVQCDLHGGSRAHGTVGLMKAIAVSCNVSAAQWACLIGFNEYHEFIKDLGLLEKPDIDLPGAVPGRVEIEEVAKTLQLMCWGFGQSMGVTPLAVASAFTSLGNDGVWMKPRLVKAIGDQEQPVQEGKAVFTSDTTSQVMQYMEAVIGSDSGTGKTLRIPGYRMAGKTGTAQRMGRGGGFVANFVGFLPAQDPKAMILVMVDQPKGPRYYGAQIAGPVYKDIARAVIRRYQLPPSSGTQLRMKPEVDVEVGR